jgi:DNA repair protein RadC
MTDSEFSVPELAVLRNSLLTEGLDALSAAELLQLFLAGRGYGVSRDEARDAVSRVVPGYTLEAIQRELSRIALVQ